MPPSNRQAALPPPNVGGMCNGRDGETEMPENPFNALVASFQEFDSASAVAALGGLQLLPENVRHATRLELAVCAAAAATQDSTKRPIRSNQLRALLNGSVISHPHLIMLEDPVGGWFIESTTFTGGEYLVIPSINTNAAIIQRHLGQALLQPGVPYTDPSFARYAIQLCGAVLALSNTVVRRAGLTRGIPLSKIHSEKTIAVPSAEHCRRLTSAVRFTGNELVEAMRFFRANAELLDAITLRAGDVQLGDFNPSVYPVQRTPIVAVSGDFIIACPGLLLSALRHAVICRALSLDVAAELAAHLADAAWRTVRAALRRMDISLSDGQLVHPPPPFISKQGLFGFDSDKAMYVCLIQDDLDGYDPNEPFGSHARQAHWPDLKMHLDAVFTELCGGSNAPNTVFCLVLLAGVGRTSLLSVDNDALLYDLLLMSVGDLDTLSRIELPNPLMLWTFARARDRLLQRSHIISTNILNDFGCYRDRDFSFYFSDNAPPTAIALGSDWEGALHEEALERADTHGVLSYDREHITEVSIVHENRAIPIYVEQPSGKASFALVIEGYALPIWVVCPKHAKYPNELTQLADLIAYWLWQVTPSFREWVATHLAPRYNVVVINIDATESLTASPPQGAQVPDPPFAILQEAGSGELRVVFSASAALLFSGPDNSGEKQLMTELIVNIGSLVSLSVSSELFRADANRIVAKHASIPTKKKLLVMDGANDPELDTRGLDKERLLSPSNQNELLDDLGLYLRQYDGLVPGPIPRKQWNEILNSAAKYYLNELESLACTLDPRGLLERLVSMHEALLRSFAFWRLTLPTRLACFEHQETLATRWKKQLSTLSATSVALRFVIEYIVARPPSGLRPYSYSVYDRMVALANEIVQVGSQSDVIFFDLDPSASLSMLPSGRLGRQFSLFESANGAHIGMLAARDVEVAPERFARRWMSPEERSKPHFVSEIEGVTKAEFGQSLARIGETFALFVRRAFDTSPAVLRIPMSEAVGHASAELGCPPGDVRDLIQRFALGPRAEFLSPPPPIKREELYPWRFTREFSYLRRPFLILGGDDNAELVIGPRHLYSAYAYLQRLCISGRLRAQSAPMRGFIGRINKESGDAFNDRVANRLLEHGGLVIKARVKKVKGIPPPPGDIDVLAFDVPRKRVFVIECKDLAFARTPREYSQELDGLFNPSVENCTLRKHLRRVRWLRDHLAQVLEFFEIEGRGKWKIEPVLVLDHHPISARLVKAPLRVFDLDEFCVMLSRKKGHRKIVP